MKTELLDKLIHPFILIKICYLNSRLFITIKLTLKIKRMINMINMIIYYKYIECFILQIKRILCLFDSIIIFIQNK